MKDSLRTGISFGLTSAVITTLGLMVGLHSGTHSKIVVLAGILTIAIADAFSDALGIHVSEEAENKHTIKQIWAATISTFLAKFLFAMTFVVPVILFTLSTAIVISLIWGGRKDLFAGCLACWVSWVRSNSGRRMKEKFS
jgi:hypothetical protein